MTSTMTLSEASHLYLKFLETVGKSQRTLYTYGKDLDQILAFFGAERTIHSLNLPLIGRFLKSDELLKLSNGKERAPQTIAKTIRVFRMLLAWLHQEGYLDEFQLPKSIPLGRTKI